MLKLSFSRYLASIIFVFFTQLSLAKDVESDNLKTQDYLARCKELNSFVGDQFGVKCGFNYQLFNGEAQKSYAPQINREIKIGTFNLLHPGTAKTLFKDFSLVAKIINEFDIVATQELVYVLGNNKDQNSRIAKYYQEVDQSEKIKKLYRLPGFIQLLNELRKLDPTWALVITPRGEAFKDGSVEELSGFFFRASQAKLTYNPHCQDVAEVGDSAVVGKYACVANFYRPFFGREAASAFSRRPFLASFVSGSAKFDLMTSHVVFNSSQDILDQSLVLKRAFGHEDWSKLPNGVSTKNYARVAEASMIVEFMQKYKQKYARALIYMGDMNLESYLSFWPSVLQKGSGELLFNKGKTTLSPARYNFEGGETSGVSSNYDHFIFDPNAVSECREGGVYNYMKMALGQSILKKFQVRDDARPISHNKIIPEIYARDLTLEEENEDSINDVYVPDIDPEIDFDYHLLNGAEAQIKKMISEYDSYLKSMYTIKRSELVWDDFQYENKLNAFRVRLFLRQLSNQSYYKIFQELVSDHLPVYINCKI